MRMASAHLLILHDIFALSLDLAMPPSSTVDEKYYQVAGDGSLAGRMVVLARDRIYADFIAWARPQPMTTVLDVGVSDVTTEGANVLERLYPHPAQITAAGLGEGGGFRTAFPAATYRQIEANQPLPFADRQFDIACANAVLEHVGSRENQRAFLAELARVARRVYITVPHRFFPVEHHTAIPLLHWTDTTFRWACAALGKREWARAENLILMSQAGLRAVCPAAFRPQIGVTGLALGPFSSNLYLRFDQG